MSGFAIPVALRWRQWTAAGLILTAAVLSGCRTVAGASAFTVLPPAPDLLAASAAAEPADALPTEASRYVPPSPPHRPPLPPYPPEALAAGAGQRVVHVRVHLDEQGAVTDITPAMRGVEWPDDAGALLFAAVAATVQAWQFTPAILEHFRLDAATGDYAFVGAERVADSIDLRFTFEPSGEVR